MSSENPLKFPLQALILFAVTVPGRNRCKYNFTLGVLFSISLFLAPSCVQTTETGGPPPPRSIRIKLPSTSPNRVVEGYLEALKKENFGKAYRFITMGYAGNVDREGFEINMRRGLVEKLEWLLLNYEVIGIKILGDRAYVVAEISTKYKPLNSQSFKLKNVRVQYDLGIIDKSWLILGDKCILNCEEGPNPESESVKPIELN